MKISFDIYRGMGWYLVPQLIAWLGATLLLLYCGKTGSFLWVNGFHFPAFDRPVFWLTQLSGGYIITAIFVLIYARAYPAETLLGIVTVFIAWYACITIKYNHFDHWKSPAVFFHDQAIHILPNPKIEPELNLPSAHATVIASLLTFFGWLYRDAKRYGLLASLVAIFLITTRVYVGWAFVEDILAGSILGTFLSLICIYWLRNRIDRWYERRSDWGKGIIIAIMRTTAISLIFVNVSNFIL